MAAFLSNITQINGQAEFTVDAVADISKLPTLEASGTGELSSVGPVSVGSTAFVIATSAVYMLNGSGNWVEI